MRIILIAITFLISSCSINNSNHFKNKKIDKGHSLNEFDNKTKKMLEDYLNSFDALVNETSPYKGEYAYRYYLTKIYSTTEEKDQYSEEFMNYICLFNTFLSEKADSQLINYLWSKTITKFKISDKDYKINSLALNHDSEYFKSLGTNYSYDSIFYYYHEISFYSGTIPCGYDSFLYLQKLDLTNDYNRLFVAIHITTFMSFFKCFTSDELKEINPASRP